MLAATLGQLLALALPLVTWALGIFSVFHLVLAGFLYMAAGTELAGSGTASLGTATTELARAAALWSTPPGYRWEDRGQGVWQLAPIVIPSGSSRGRRWH